MGLIEDIQYLNETKSNILLANVEEYDELEILVELGLLNQVSVRLKELLNNQILTWIFATLLGISFVLISVNELFIIIPLFYILLDIPSFISNLKFKRNIDHQYWKVVNTHELSLIKNENNKKQRGKK
jgi:hypothetical protein